MEGQVTIQCGVCGRELKYLCDPCDCGADFTLDPDPIKPNKLDLSKSKKYTIRIKPDINLGKRSN